METAGSVSKVKNHIFPKFIIELITIHTAAWPGLSVTNMNMQYISRPQYISAPMAQSIIFVTWHCLTDLLVNFLAYYFTTCNRNFFIKHRQSNSHSIYCPSISETQLMPMVCPIVIAICVPIAAVGFYLFVDTWLSHVKFSTHNSKKTYCVDLIAKLKIKRVCRPTSQCNVIPIPQTVLGRRLCD